MTTPLLRTASVLGLLVLPLIGFGADASVLPPTTRQQTIRPIAVPAGTPAVLPKQVASYGPYAAWQIGPGEDQGRKFDLMPTGYTGATNAARLLTFFAFSDVHITDKESPAQVPFFGWNAPFQISGLYSQAYSPVELSTTQVLDAAVRTVNALHRQTPFDFGLVLGDVLNSSQFNELRWFIDVMDGKLINPSSGAHLGADTIGFQKPFQAAGLDRSIPWYQVVGNHDQFWMGVSFPSDKVKAALVGDTVINIGPNLFAPDVSEQTGVYVGVIDGTSPLGEVIKGGPTSLFDAPPTVVADPDRRILTTAESFNRNFINEFFNTTSSPVGHGFNRSASGSTAGCYTFEPVANLPIKVIVLDDTCKTVSPGAGPSYYGSGWLDVERYNWLTTELQKGQDAGQLMIVACHIPVNPQKDLFEPAPAVTPQFYPASYQSDAQLIATLHRYPNLIMLMAGHRHLNVVTPQPSPDPTHPEFGFWEVENSSLRDFPQQFRTFDIRRNSDNTISILTTNVDPATQTSAVAAASLGYAIGAYRIFGNGTLTDATSHAYNAELIKPLTPAMQAKIAGYGTSLFRAVNFSALGRIDTTHPLTAGFVIENAPHRVLLRAVGPELRSSFGITAAAADPQFSLVRLDGSTAATVGTNNNWNATDTATMAQAGAFPLSPGSKDAAAIFTLSPGAYTVTVRPADDQAGQTLVELYDLDGNVAGGVVNFSARGWLVPGGTLTPGVVTTGSGTLLVRAVGPGLAPFGVAGPLGDPRLEVWPGRATAAAATNDNWAAADAAAMTKTGAFSLTVGSKDAALLYPITSSGNAPQSLTIPVSAPATDQGECLVEVYLVK